MSEENIDMPEKAGKRAEAENRVGAEKEVAAAEQIKPEGAGETGACAANSEETAPEALSWWSRRKIRRAQKKEERRRKEEEKSLFQNICEMVAFTAGAVCVALIIKNYVGQPIIVDGDSMNDTLENHNVVWANKVNYTPERYDVVIVQPYAGKKTLFIKRVIALPGETISIYDDDHILITDSEGEVVLDGFDPYGYFSGPIASQGILYPNNADGSYTLGEDEYFCMGDNRYNSRDSRALGAFSADQIKGHAVFRLWPLSEFGKIEQGDE